MFEFCTKSIEKLARLKLADTQHKTQKTLHNRQNKCQYLLLVLLFCFNKCLLLLSAFVVYHLADILQKEEEREKERVRAPVLLMFIVHVCL